MIVCISNISKKLRGFSYNCWIAPILFVEREDPEETIALYIMIAQDKVAVFTKFYWASLVSQSRGKTWFSSAPYFVI